MQALMDEQYFRQWSELVMAHVVTPEVLLVNFSGESTDFARFNHGQYRQCGHVVQGEVSLRLIRDQRAAVATLNMTGILAEDLQKARQLIEQLRLLLPELPEDPHLLISEEINSSSDQAEGEAVDLDEAMPSLLKAGEGRDLVGIWASGWICKGFANSLGQVNWKSSNSFHFDWTYYLQADQAVKSGYAGQVWDEAAFEAKVEHALEELELLKRDPMTLKPGGYRTYLSPAALDDFMQVLNWRGGFSTRAKARKSSILMRLHEGQAQLSDQIGFTQCPSRGLEAGFEGSGFMKADEIRLFDQGKPVTGLTDPRSAREFGLEVNNGAESAGSLEMDAGTLAMADIPALLGDGLYLNNTHYLNTSNLSSARVTGMTRFACFWVEGGEVKAPIKVMRFDESFYRMLGENLIGITAERERLISGSTYHARSTGSSLLPGVLVDDFRLKL